MPDDLVVKGLVIPGAELEERFETSGGPGGQHANRNQTTVRLRFEIGDSSLPEDIRAKLVSRLGESVEVVAGERRSQARNREVARDRLVAKMEAALEDPKPRRRTKPTRAAREQRLSDKRKRSRVKRSRRPADSED